LNSKQIKYKNIRIFVDFDGTITKSDLGNEVFRELIGNELFVKLHNQFLQNEISIKTYWRLICDGITELNYEKLKNSIDLITLKYEIDDYFIKFIDILKSNNIEITIISDGFEEYIKPILQKYNLNLNYYSNKLVNINNKITPLFQFQKEGCECLSASCKKMNLLKNTFEEDLVIYIGDGLSDFCPAEHSDIVFAKGKLSKYCNQNNIPHYNFKTFFEINLIMKKIFDNQNLSIGEKSNKQIKEKLKIRNSAFIKRKLTFEVE